MKLLLGKMTVTSLRKSNYLKSLLGSFYNTLYELQSLFADTYMVCVTFRIY